jgi:PEP-CTERM motif
MRFSKLLVLGVLGALLVVTVSAFADSWVVYNQPSGRYVALTTNFGGGDGSGGTITSLGPFTFSNPQVELSVPNSWGTWGCPPATESCTPNVLYNDGFSTLHIDFGALPSRPGLPTFPNIIGWENEPDLFQVETISYTFNSSTGDSFTLLIDPDGNAGALLTAVEDGTPGASITSVDIVDLSGDDFATAQFRAGTSQSATPEPSTILMLGSGLLGAIGMMRRKLNF